MFHPSKNHLDSRGNHGVFFYVQSFQIVAGLVHYVLLQLFMITFVDNSLWLLALLKHTSYDPHVTQPCITNSSVSSCSVYYPRSAQNLIVIQNPSRILPPFTFCLEKYSLAQHKTRNSQIMVFFTRRLVFPVISVACFRTKVLLPTCHGF